MLTVDGQDEIVGSSESRRLRVRSVAGLAIVSAALFPVGWWFIFTQFQTYDDEGILVLLLREWAHRGGLYSRVESRYGPAYTFFYGLPQRLLGADLTYTSGRVVTLLLWLAISFVLGAGVLALGGSLLTGILAQVASFFLLVTLTWEPTHPGGLLCLGLALIVLTVAALQRHRPAMCHVLLGLLVGTLVMTKINIGVFAVVALAYSFATAAPTSRSRVLRPLTEFALVALGPILILLQHPHVIATTNFGAPSEPAHALGARFIDQWAINYAVVYAAAALILVLVVRIYGSETDRSVDLRAVVRFGAGTSVAIAFFSVFALVTGTSLGALAQGLIFRPLTESRSALTLPAQVNGSVVVVWVLVALGLLVMLPRLRRMKEAAPPSIRPTVLLWGGMLRIAAAGIGLAGVVRSSSLSLLPLAAVCLLAPSASGGVVRSSVGRRTLAALAVAASLHAIPVAGSQVSWSVMLLVPALSLVLYDGWTVVLMARPQRPAWLRTPRIPIVCCLVVLLASPWPGAAPLGGASGAAQRYFRTGVDPQLPGTAGLRLDPGTVRDLRSIVKVLRRECTQFFSVPEYASLYLLSGREPPNGMNATVWMFLLNASEQQSVVDQLERTDGTVCLVERAPADAPPWTEWSFGRPIPDGPLVRYLSTGFETKLVVPPYRVLERVDS